MTNITVIFTRDGERIEYQEGEAPDDVIKETAEMIFHIMQDEGVTR